MSEAEFTRRLVMHLNGICLELESCPEGSFGYFLYGCLAAVAGAAAEQIHAPGSDALTSLFTHSAEWVKTRTLPDGTPVVAAVNAPNN